MTDEPSVNRRTLLQGSALAALGTVPGTVLAEEGRTIAYYANEEGVVDVDGVGDAAFDFREELIDESLLRDVIDHWQSGESVAEDGSANPARLIDAHVETLRDTSFELDVREFEGGPGAEPTKEILFEWDNERERSHIAETSAENRAVGLSQLFTDDRQHVDIEFDGDERNQASLDIDEGPVYIDGSDLLDRLLIGASLSVTGQVPVGDRTLPRYEIASHRRLDDVEGYVVGDEGAYVAAFELRWTTPDGERVGIEVSTDTERAGTVTTHGSFESTLGSADAGETTDVATGHDTFATIRDLSPAESEPLEYGSRETFEFTIDYDIGNEPPGYFSVSVREEEWGSIGEYVEIDEASGSVDVSYTRNVGDDWDQARLIGNLYPEADGCPGVGCINSVVASDEVVYETTDDAGSGDGGAGSLPDLEVHDVTWSPADPEPDETVEFSVEVENTGDAAAETIETRVFVDGELAHVPPTIDLDPGERRWTVETGNQSFGPGEHTVRAVIDPDDKIAEQSREENELERVLTVDGDAATIDARVQWIDPVDGTYGPDEEVTTTAGVENTGNVEHTFFVGYTVHGPAGGSYDNDGGTGRTVTLDPGESTWVDLDWTVEPDATDGSYDVEVAVWQETDRDSLYTRLDGAEESRAFTVDTTSELPDLTIDAIEWRPASPRDSEDVTFTVTVANEGEAQASGFDVRLTVGSETFVEPDSGALGAGDRRAIEFGAWAATAGTSTVHAVADPDGEIEERDEHDNELSREITVGEHGSDITVRSIESTSSTYEIGETASVSARVENSDDRDVTVSCAFDLTGPNGEQRTERVERLLPAGTTESAVSRWELTDDYAAGSYDVAVTVSVDEGGEAVATEERSELFSITGEPRAVELRIRTRTARGDPLDGATVTLTDSAGSGSESAVSSDGSVRFDDVDPGTYELTASSSRLHQTVEREVIVDGRDDITRLIRFGPTGPVQGVVMDAAEDQLVSGAVVSLPEFRVTAETDGSGRFRIDEPIPDGEHEFRITTDGSRLVTATTDDGELRETKAIGLERTVSFSAPVDTESVEGEADEVLSEENPMVAFVVRNLDRSDLGVPIQLTFIKQYGMAKGAVSALVDFVDSLRELLRIDLAEFVEGIRELLSLIVDEPSILAVMGMMMIEGFQEKQREENPFEEGTAEHRTFQAGWFPAYVGVTIAVGFLAGKGAGNVARIAGNATRFRTSIGDLGDRVRNADRVPDEFALGARSDTGSTGVGRATFAGTVQRAPFPDLTKTVLWGYRDIRRRVGDAHAPVLFRSGDRRANDWDEIDQGRRTQLRGELGEIDWGRQLLRNVELPGSTLVGIATNLPGRIAAGTAYIIKPPKTSIDTPDGSVDVEFDYVLVERLPSGSAGTDGALSVRTIWEVTTSRNRSGGEKREQKRESLRRIREAIDSGTLDPTDEIGGIPFGVLARTDDADVLAVGPRGDNRGGFDATLSQSSDAYEDTARHLFENRDVYDGRYLPGS